MPFHPPLEPLAIAVPVSRDSKIGMASATHAAQASCPADCPIRAECYAGFGTQSYTTRRLNRAAQAWERATGRRPSALDVARVEARAIRAMRSRLDLRLHIVGDGATRAAARELRSAGEWYMDRTGARVWTYSHAWRRVERADWGRISVLASVENLADARAAMRRGWAAACIVAAFPANGKAYVDGTGRNAVTVIPCPNQVAKTRGDARPIQCVDCRLCLDDAALLARRAVIGFEPHGTRRNSLLRVIQG